MAGRKPVPKEVRDLTGNKASHPPANPKGLKIKRPIGGPPSWMNKMQKEIWREGVASAPRNLLRKLDTSVYQAWVFACYSHRRAIERFEQEGGDPVVMTVNGGTKQNPLLSIIRSEAAAMQRLASEMGFTPTARMKVAADGDDETPANPFDQFADAGKTDDKKPTKH